ncbi:MAG: PASTA domain-containing protein [Oscillospiraceae bacterium]|nr:PASTA domain-containing protein [Oscillospiraceae bacterium]
MKKFLFLIVCSILPFLLSACNYEENNENLSDDNSIVSATNIAEKLPSEEEQLQNLLNVLAPITDRSLLLKINDFYSIAIQSSLSSNSESVIDQLSDLKNEIVSSLDNIINSTIPSGYAIQDDWDILLTSCLALKNDIENTMIALEDNDPNRVLNLRKNIENTTILEEALSIQNTLSGKISEIQEEQEKLNIAAIYTYDECLSKATKYARYYFENPNITEFDLNGNNSPIVIDDISGKHYSFTLAGNDNVIILINVEDCSIICKEITRMGYSYKYINDDELPSEHGDIAMPNIIGMNCEEAKELLNNMNITYDEEILCIDTDKVPEGNVAHCYPSPGNIVTNDPVKIFKEIEY